MNARDNKERLRRAPGPFFAKLFRCRDLGCDSSLPSPLCHPFWHYHQVLDMLAPRLNALAFLPYSYTHPIDLDIRDPRQANG